MIAESCGEAGVDLCALGRLIEDVAEGVDALDEAGGYFVGGALAAAHPNGAEGQGSIESETGQWRGSGNGHECGGGLDQGCDRTLGADDAAGFGDPPYDSAGPPQAETPR